MKKLVVFGQRLSNWVVEATSLENQVKPISLGWLAVETFAFCALLADLARRLYEAANSPSFYSKYILVVTVLIVLFLFLKQVVAVSRLFVVRQVLTSNDEEKKAIIRNAVSIIDSRAGVNDPLRLGVIVGMLILAGVALWCGAVVLPVVLR
ncbi:hypothetical protein [Ruegeria sp. HKCCD6604]|uniref:hypothetical protein n=1 Tax=Ruegeria sp. HKCCD6604 TaxID=2683000 RepID=UPI001492BBF2|nr:hypothetical protein [Ruegeria sp. HKCCD6604]NOC91356.1 hypothetical protein [Ruegeria sp. HKCCD6604]